MITDTIYIVITTAFLLIVLSYYFLLFHRPKKKPVQAPYKSVTIIIPARNEERYIAAAITSVQHATFPGKKQIIVINDASLDNTAKIAQQYDVLFLQNKKHMGKSYSLNKALAKATGDLVAIVDGDSIIREDALTLLGQELAQKNVVGAGAVVKVRNRTAFINIWVHIELLYSSLLRELFSKAHANVVTPGALSMYRRKELLEVGGFSTEGFSEDMDVAVKLIRKGYHVGFSNQAYSETNMPDDVKGFLRQRTRIARGLINVLKRHMQANTTIIDLYTLPLFLFTYIQAAIMGMLMTYKIVSGYMTYFVEQGTYMSWGVGKFFFEWLSAVGFLKWTWKVLSGAEPLTFISVVGIMSTLLTYPLFLYAMLKYDKKVDILHVIPFVFMFPYWLVQMFIYILCIPEIFMREQYNRWKKNE